VLLPSAFSEQPLSSFALSARICSAALLPDIALSAPHPRRVWFGGAVVAVLIMTGADFCRLSPQAVDKVVTKQWSVNVTYRHASGKFKLAKNWSTINHEILQLPTMGYAIPNANA